MGEVVVKPYRDRSISFRQGLPVVIKSMNFSHQSKIEYAKQLGHRFGVKFEGIGDRTEAENWREREVYCLYSDLPKKENGEFYVFELLGLNVIDEQNEIFGKIREVLNMPGNDVLVIDSPAGEVLVPFTGNVIESVSVERQEVKISTIRDYLL
ncbi:MAG: 16S rRNA processing protein RimM [candidate division Zixibacteria bacterium]|nr:16S rRNA processing protein RimM [candidate division Zixibacteria bacterium]